MLSLSYDTTLRMLYPVSSMRNRGIPLQVERRTVTVLSNLCPYIALRQSPRQVDPIIAPPVLRVLMHSAHLPTRSTAPPAPSMTNKKNTRVGKTRKAGSRPVKETAAGVGQQHKQSPRHKNPGAASRSKRPSTPAAPALNPAPSNFTPPGDNASSTSSLSTPSPLLRRSTRNPSVTAHPPAVPNSSAVTTASAPIPAITSSTSGKRKREDDAAVDADTNDRSARPTRRRKPTARALEAMEERASQGGKTGSRVRRATPACKKPRA